MIYRKDESKEDTLKYLEAERSHLKRLVRTIENSIDWLKSTDKEDQNARSS